jgi:CheY-like chemotaxis protein
MTILLVEDDALIQLDLSALLRDEGYAVVTANHGQEALEWLRSGPRPDLILLDLNMPVMDGWAFREAQLADAALAEIPVVVLSGLNDPSANSQAFHSVVRLAKPIQLDRLLRVVRQHGGERR